MSFTLARKVRCFEAATAGNCAKRDNMACALRAVLPLPLLLVACRYALAKWVRARPYVTAEELAARVAAYKAAQQQQMGTDAQAHLSQLSQLLAVAVAR